MRQRLMLWIFQEGKFSNVSAGLAVRLSLSLGQLLTGSI